MKIKNIFFIIIFISLSAKTTVAYDTNNVHPLINENALFQSNVDDYLKNKLGFEKGMGESLNGKEIKEWFEEGGKAEDEPLSRTMNHFHDPTKAWNEAGLNDYCVILPVTGESSVLWAQKTTQIDGDTWSWQKAREYYYLGLTATTKEVREQNLANTFKTVGHIMHLVSDVSVPDMKFEAKGLLQ